MTSSLLSVEMCIMPQLTVFSSAVPRLGIFALRIFSEVWREHGMNCDEMHCRILDADSHPRTEITALCHFRWVGHIV